MAGAVGSIMVNMDLNPSPTMVDLLPRTKMALGMALQDTGKDAMLCWLAERAVAKYGELVPVIKRNVLSTVRGQVAYPLPGDCRKVLDVLNPSQFGYYNDFLFLPMIDTPSASLFGFSDYAFRSPSERVLRNQILGEMDHYVQTFSDWRQDGNTLFIMPVADADGIAVNFRYEAQHVNQNAIDPLNPTFTTLTPGHWPYIVDLIKWALNDQRADQISSSMVLSDAGGGNAQLTEAWKLSNRADRLLQLVRSALGADATAIVRS